MKSHTFFSLYFVSLESQNIWKFLGTKMSETRNRTWETCLKIQILSQGTAMSSWPGSVDAVLQKFDQPTAWDTNQDPDVQGFFQQEITTSWSTCAASHYEFNQIESAFGCDFWHIFFLDVILNPALNGLTTLVSIHSDVIYYNQSIMTQCVIQGFFCAVYNTEGLLPHFEPSGWYQLDFQFTNHIYLAVVFLM